VKLRRICAAISLVAAQMVILRFPHAPIDQGGEMRAAFMSIEEAVVTYLEGMTLASQNAELGDSGARRRR
jgi:hypothetical protein